MWDGCGLGIDVGSLGCRFAVVRDGTPVPLWVPRQFDDALIEAARADPADPDPVGRSLLWKDRLGQAEAASAGDPFGPEFVCRLLDSGRRAAEIQASASMRRAVLCVPAGYFAGQRQILQHCAEAAGLPGAQFVGSAAALVADRAVRRSDGRLLVYQCGYLVLDVALVAVDQGRIEVIARQESEALSGRILDALLAERLATRAYLSGADRAALLHEGHTVRRMASTLREQLARGEQAAVCCGPAGGRRLTAAVTRRDYDQWMVQAVETTLPVVNAVLADAAASPHTLSDVLVFGGPTAHPAFRDVLSRHLGRPATRLHDWAAAFGAALLADILPAPLEARPEVAPTVAADGRDQERVEPVRESAGQAVADDAGPSTSPPESGPLMASLSQKLAMRALERAERLLAQGRRQEAVAMSHRAFKDDSQSGEILDAMLGIHRRAAEAESGPEGYARAVEWLQCANSHDPGNVEIRSALAERHLHHARQMIDRGEFAEALRAAESAFLLRPESPEVENALRQARERAGGGQGA